MLQHAIGIVPDRRHGYCLDDNARALMLMNVAAGLTDAGTRALEHDVRLVRPARLERGPRRVPQLHELRPHLVRGLRLGGFQRPHALGARPHLRERARRRPARVGAALVRHRAAAAAPSSTSPRAMAFTMLGAAAVLRAQPGHNASRDAAREGRRSAVPPARALRAGPTGPGSRPCSATTTRACRRR